MNIPKDKRGRIEQKEIQTGEPRGTFKTGDKHPSIKGLFFKKLYPDGEHWSAGASLKGFIEQRNIYLQSDQCKKKKADYHQKTKHTDAYKASKKKYKQSCKGKISSARYHRSPAYKKTQKKYQNSAKGSASRKRVYEKARTIPEKVICKNLRAHMRRIRPGFKSESTGKILGCTIEHCCNHLESQFAEGMTWDNYGEWHIDHIIPCAFFDLTKPSHQKVCFNWQNLQPLWESDNCSKGDKIPWYVLLTILMNNYKTITV
jgi:hypothetical protein